MVGTTAFQNGLFQRVTCDSKLAVESARFEKRQLRLPQSKCCSPNVARIAARSVVVLRSRNLVVETLLGHDAARPDTDVPPRKSISMTRSSSLSEFVRRAYFQIGARSVSAKIGAAV